jgi:N-acetylneuraminic acid mutarotase
MPFSRVSAMAWSMAGKGYVFGGRDSTNILHNDLWEYDPVTDSWQKICDSPLQARVNGVACVADGKVYIGLGFTQGVYNPASYLQDWWEYEPNSTTWTKLADYPNRNTVGPSVYVKDDKIYCVHGFGTGFTADVVVYDIVADDWHQIETKKYLDRACMAGAGTTLDDRCFYGTGYNTHNLSDWYEIDFTSSWERRASVPGERQMATCVATDEYIYIVGGRKFGGSMSGGKIHDDILRYDVHKDEWGCAGAMSVPAEGAFSFSIDGVAYVGGGEDEEKVLNTLYKIED